MINQDQIEQTHCATLDVLERTGVDIPHTRALETLAGSGAKVDGSRVRMPSWMIEEAIRKVPSRIVLGARTGKRTITLERDKTFFGPSLDCIDYLDPKTHTRSRFVSENVKVTAALCDALPHLHCSILKRLNTLKFSNVWSTTNGRQPAARASNNDSSKLPRRR